MAIKANSAQLKYRFFKRGGTRGVVGAAHHKVQVVLYCNLAKKHLTRELRCFCGSTLSILHFLKFQVVAGRGGATAPLAPPLNPPLDASGIFTDAYYFV